MRLSWKFQGNENGEQYNAQILTAKVSITILNQPFCPHYHCRAHGSHHHFRAHGSHHHRRWRRRRRLPRPPPPFACTVSPRTAPKSCLHLNIPQSPNYLCYQLGEICHLHPIFALALPTLNNSKTAPVISFFSEDYSLHLHVCAAPPFLPYP